MSGKIYTRSETIKVKPNEACKLQIEFWNMPPCPLRYELDPRDGVVTEDGTYTASDKQGVHVIRVLCAHDPLINTFAYADVKK